MQCYTKGDVIEVKNEIYVVLVVINTSDYIKHLICFDGNNVVLVVVREIINSWVEYDEVGYVVSTGTTKYPDYTVIDVTRGIDLRDINEKIQNFNK